MKKLISLILIGMMLLTSAQAGGLLPTPEKLKDELGVEIISFGVTNDLEPSSTKELEDGSFVETYTGVTAEHYNAFSVRLGEEGDYAVVDYTMEEGVINIVISKQEKLVHLSYDEENGTFVVTYPADAKIEEKKIPDPFEGYVRLNIGDVVKTERGKFTVSEFVTDRTHSEVWTTGDKDIGVSGYWLHGKLDNTSKNTQYFIALISGSLHYINEDGIYSYPMGEVHGYSGDDTFYLGGKVIRSGGKYTWASVLVGREALLNNVSSYPITDYPGVYSMTEGEWAVDFVDVPDRVYQATDGILAVTLKFTGNDTNYVLYIRGGE